MLNVDKWPEVALGDLVTIKHGWAFKGEQFTDERRGRPIVVNIGNFRYTGGFRFSESTVREYTGTYPRDYELMSGEILLAMTCQTSGGEILGIPARVPDDGQSYLHNQRLGKVIVRENDAIDSSFLYWLFLWPKFNRSLVETASGTKILHTSPARIEAFRFRLPPLEEQQAIRMILDSIENKIELNRRMNQTLEEIARTIFKSWFIDFDPVRAKAKGRQPAGMDAETAALFPNSFEDSELGPIPARWMVRSIADLAEVVGGSTPSTKEHSYWAPGAHHWVTPKDLSSLSTPVLLKSERLITNEGLRQISSGLLPPGTVLLSSRAPIGYVAITEVPIAINQGFIAMKAKLEISNLYLWLWTVSSIANIVSRANGSTFLEISKSQFRPIQLIGPTSEIMRCFDTLVRPIYERIVSNERETRLLATARDLLLPKLLSGELRVSEVDLVMKDNESIIANPGRVSLA